MRYGAVVLNRCAAHKTQWKRAIFYLQTERGQTQVIVHILTTNLRNLSLFRSCRVFG
jgi:hypothetical protein